MTEYHQTAVSRLFSVSRLVTVYYRELPKGYENLGEAHRFWEFLYLDRGALTLFLDGEEIPLKQGQMILYPPDSFHSNAGRPLEQGAGVGIVSFVCDSPAMEELRQRVCTPDRYQRELMGDLLRRGDRCFEPAGEGKKGIVLRKDAPLADPQVIANKLELLLLSLWEQENRSTPARNNQNNLEESLALQIEDYCKRHLREKLSLEQIGTRFGVSVSTVKQVFSRRFSHGVITHCNLLRIAEAKRLISDSGLNFTQIADRLGFGSVHYFSRLFRRVTGMSPSEYAKSIVYGE